MFQIADKFLPRRQRFLSVDTILGQMLADAQLVEVALQLTYLCRTASHEPCQLLNLIVGRTGADAAAFQLADSGFQISLRFIRDVIVLSLIALQISFQLVSYGLQRVP
ncbi:hypothetical protein SDC9_103548 [bioreactor metagenome]|uniref:Uncharacterized protein n=1 Tax=bioreactor metagenome TaxID=1076179 RepID=A0A645B4T4_9ZZZZ